MVRSIEQVVTDLNEKKEDRRKRKEEKKQIEQAGATSEEIKQNRFKERLGSNPSVHHGHLNEMSG